MNQLNYLSRSLKNLVYYFHKYLTEIKLIYIRYIYKYISLYILLIISFVFLYNIYLYIIKVYKDINDIDKWKARVKEEKYDSIKRRQKQAHYDIYHEEYVSTIKNTKPIDWYIGLVALSLLLTQDYWIMYWLYTTYDYMLLQKNWVYWVQNDIIIFLKLVGLLISIALFIYIFTLFLTFVIEPFYVWFLNYIKNYEKVSIFSIIGNFFTLLKNILCTIPKGIKDYPVIIIRFIIKYIKLSTYYLVFSSKQILGFSYLFLQILSWLVYLLFVFLFKACLWYFIKDVLILNIGQKLWIIFSPFFIPYLIKILKIYIYILQLLRIILLPAVFFFKIFISLVIFLIIFLLNKIINIVYLFIFRYHNHNIYLNYILFKLSNIVSYLFYKLSVTINNFKAKYYEGTRVHLLNNWLKKKKRVFNIYIIDKEILLYMSSYLIYFKGNLGIKYYLYNFLKNSSKSRSKIYFKFINSLVTIYYIYIKIIYIIKDILNKYVITLLNIYIIYIYNLLKLLITSFRTFDSKYNNIRFKYLYIISHYLDILDYKIGFRTLPIALLIWNKLIKLNNSLINKTIYLFNKPLLNNDQSIKVIFLKIPYLFYSLIRYLIKDILLIQINNLYEKYLNFYEIRRKNYYYMLTLLYINFILVPLPISFILWSLLYKEEIIDIEYKFAVLTSKLVFLLFHLILGWIILFMDIHIESNKNEDFNEKFHNFKNSFMVHMLNFALIVVFFTLIVFFYQHCWIGIDGEGFIKNLNYELLEPYKIYGNITDKDCQLCAAFFTMAKMSIGVYFFIYWLFFKTLAEFRINIFRFFWLFKEFKYKVFYLQAENKIIYEFTDFYQEYRVRLLLRVMGLIFGILILFLMGYLFCNIFVYKIFIIRGSRILVLP